MCRYGLLGLVRLVCSDSFSGSIKTRIKTRINRAKSLKLRCGVRRRSHRRSHCVVPRADVFNLIFVVDMLAKLYGLGCIGYWGDGWNALVYMTVAVRVLEMLFVRRLGFNLSFLRIIRTFRVLRVLRLMRTCGRACT